MAPSRQVKKRSSIRSRAERSAKDVRGIYAPPKNYEANVPPSFTGPSDTSATTAGRQGRFDEGLKITKKDKRTIRHNQLLAKVQAGGIRKRPLQRRRNSKKELANGMGELKEALPDIEESDDGDDWEGIEDADSGQVNDRATSTRKDRSLQKKIVMKSLRHRPGAMKRKDRLERSERERFAANLANMAGVVRNAGDASAASTSNTSSVETSAADRWQALRTFIGSTLEKDKAFLSR